MEIRRDFDVAAPPGEVFELLVDLERVGGCIPGGRVGAASEGVHPASILVRLGPMRFDYQGTVRMIERVDGSRRAVLAAELRERRGQGRASAQMTMDVSAESGSGAGSRVESVTELELTGRAAQMGRGVIDDVAERMVAEMADCIGARLAAPEPGVAAAAGSAAPQNAPPVRGIRLGLAVLWTRIKRRLRAIWAALAGIGRKRRGGDHG
jgi:carbon monoxide dehydrogenase subunit G